jgi:monofunctional biosynthetic peptidoglycan transglycosylase
VDWDGWRSWARRALWRAWTLRALAALLVLLVAYHNWVFLEVWRLRTHDPQTTAFMRIGLEHLRERDPRARLEHRWVPYERISPWLKRAVIAAEDQKFLEHHGFDVQAMEEAYAKNARHRGVRRGGSTISQQLAKNLFLSPSRSYLRKLHEAMITVVLEHVLTKRRILEIYLNVVEWGGGIYGAEAASQHYFGRPASDLSAAEAARLASMLPSPRSYTGDPYTPYLDERTDDLLPEMERVRIP